MLKITLITLLACISNVMHASAESYELCPGLYCGRVIDENGNASQCQACPSGYRTNEATICEECSSSPTLYDWLYLGFMFMLVPILNFFFIDYTNKRKNLRQVILHVSALLESALSIIFTLLCVPPLGSLSVTSCSVQGLSDWYTMFYNPSPDYVHTLHCTQEAVYPLYTLVLIYYAFSLVTMMLVRPLLSAQYVHHQGTACIYAALYFLPILVVTHAVLAGLLYYSFPYLTVLVSLITNAIHLAMFTNQHWKSLLLETVTSVRHVVILVSHWLLYSYGIISITELSEPAVHAPLLLLVPLPAFFYLLTVRFTDPDKLEVV